VPDDTGNGEENGTEETVEVAEEIAEEIAEVIEESEPTNGPDIDVTVIEDNPPVIPETSYVDVGDLHISGPPEMVERVTSKYLKDHIDHNPHNPPHDALRDAVARGVEEHGAITEIASDVTPDVVEEQITDSAAADIVDNPPDASDWLFRPLGGRS
jgi:hypothetical protein